MKNNTTNGEGIDFEWVNKDTLEMKECNQGEIITAKESILFSINRLRDLNVVDAETAISVLEQLNIEDEKE